MEEDGGQLWYWNPGTGVLNPDRGRAYHSPSLRRGLCVVPPLHAQSIENEPGEQGAGNGAHAIGDAVQERGVAADKVLNDSMARTQGDEPEDGLFYPAALPNGAARHCSQNEVSAEM